MTENSDGVPQVERRVKTYGGVSSSLCPGWLGEVRHNSAIPPETVPVSLLGLRDPAAGSSGWGAGCMRRAFSSRETASPVETNRSGPSVWGPEDLESLRSFSSTISTLAISSSSCWWISSSSCWQISSSRQASSSSMWRTSYSSIRQSWMRFLNFMMDLSTTLREVCKVFNLCSISLQDGGLVSTSMAFDTASNSSRSLVCLLWHFCREEVDLLRFLSLCLLFSLRTWSITSSNWRLQVVPGARK